LLDATWPLFDKLLMTTPDERLVIISEISRLVLRVPSSANKGETDLIRSDFAAAIHQHSLFLVPFAI